MEQTIRYIIQTINGTENLDNEEFNSNADSIKVYCLVYGEDSYNKIKNQSIFGRLYYITSALIDYFKQNKIQIELANDCISQIKNYQTRNSIKWDLVRYAIEQGDIEMAERITLEIPEEDDGVEQYQAQRELLNYYASAGDIEAFKKKIILSKINKYPRYPTEHYKYKLIEGISKKHGIKYAFEALNNKYFEKSYSIGVFRWAAHLISIEELDYYLNTYPRVLNESKTARAELFVSHFSEQGHVAIPQAIFERTMEEILKTDKDAKCGDYRCRDSLLIDLGASTLYKKQALECKKHIISPIVKRELNCSIKHLEESKQFLDL